MRRGNSNGTYIERTTKNVKWAGSGATNREAHKRRAGLTLCTCVIQGTCAKTTVDGFIFMAEEYMYQQERETWLLQFDDLGRRRPKKYFQPRCSCASPFYGPKKKHYPSQTPFLSKLKTNSDKIEENRANINQSCRKGEQSRTGHSASYIF